jgi:DNA-binding FadR family transcriptional regulator
MGEEHRALLADLASDMPERAEAAIADHLHRVLARWAPSVLDSVGPDAFGA